MCKVRKALSAFIIIMINPTKQQAAALEMVKKSKLSILMGSPGSGKTTATKTIVDWAKDQKYSISLCSPTGKAAHVLSEVCNHPASTIHRLLKPQAIRKHGKLQFYFQHDKENPLPFTFIIIDECSMIGNDLMSSLLQAIDPETTKVLLVGDAAQLPSVTPGNVLHDLIACKMIPYVELTKIFRHAGEIVRFCSAIRTDDRMYVLPKHPAKKLNLEVGNNYLHIETSSIEAIKKTIVKLATVSIPDKYGFSIDNGDIQVLSPVNSKTILSCDSLNTAIQDIVNPQPVENCIENKNGNGVSFRLNSKIINVRNTYDAIDTEGNKQIILNGDLGKITKLNESDNKMIVTFQDPERKIILNKWKNDLKLSYVLTCHKSQGSQWNVIILPVHSTFQYSFSRALLYTACSRSKTILLTIGQQSAISQARRDTKIYFRKTFLSEKIQDKILGSL